MELLRHVITKLEDINLQLLNKDNTPVFSDIIFQITLLIIFYMPSDLYPEVQVHVSEVLKLEKTMHKFHVQYKKNTVLIR